MTDATDRRFTPQPLDRRRCSVCGTPRHAHSATTLTCPTMYRPESLAVAATTLLTARARRDNDAEFVARGEVQRLGGDPDDFLTSRPAIEAVATFLLEGRAVEYGASPDQVAAALLTALVEARRDVEAALDLAIADAEHALGRPRPAPGYDAAERLPAPLTETELRGKWGDR